MVVIGHSQGGLLTKLISIDSGAKLWDAISEKPMDELNLKPETTALLKEALFVHHLPFVETVIFVATPHGGSYQSSLTVVGLFTRLVTLPLTVASATADVLANAGDALKYRTFNSLSGMSPGNPAIEALRKIPVAHGSRLTRSFRRCRTARWRPATTARWNTRAPTSTGGVRACDRTLRTLDPRQPDDGSR